MIPARSLALLACLAAGVGTVAFASPQTGWPPLLTSPAQFAKTTTYVGPSPDHAPAFTPGQEFIADSWITTQYERVSLEDAGGVPLPPEIYWYKVLTLVAVESQADGAKKLTFRAENGVLGSLTTNPPIDRLDNLMPLVEDGTLRTLRAMYEGRSVWSYGDPDLQCVATNRAQLPSIAVDKTRPYRIRKIYRVFRTEGLYLGQRYAFGNPRLSDLGAVNPIIVLADLPTGSRVTDVTHYHYQPGVTPDRQEMPVTRKVAGTDRNAGAPSTYCRFFFQRYADAWDFERTFSLTSPYPNWTASQVRSVLAGELKRGLTKEMVVRIAGFPSAYGTAAQIMRLDHWQYGAGAPFILPITFKNGKVVWFGADGRLP